MEMGSQADSRSNVIRMQSTSSGSAQVESSPAGQGLESSRAASFSWLCPSMSHRERFLDMQERVHAARVVTIGFGVALTLAFLPRGGWPILVLGAVMLVIVLVGGLRLDRRRRPELWVFVSAVLNIQLTITVGCVFSGGPRTTLSSLLAVPVLMVGARFSDRGLIVGTPISVALVLLATVGVDPSYVWQHPESVIVPLALVIIAAAYLSPLVASDVRHRANSTLDPLTEVLNVRALHARLAEVTEQAAVNGQPVSVVALDIDQFKAINDVHGHGAGDLALRRIADVLRERLRTFELLYRVGGDEFLLLLPGASCEHAARIAESLRLAVRHASPLGVPLTCSFGVGTARAEIDAKRLIEEADIALYRAKRYGGDRVEIEASVPKVADAA
jgi:diguanylate cyclase (GGDEF)-like protein